MPHSKFKQTLGLTLAAIAAPQLAHAFAEDVCYAPGGGPIVTCMPLPAVCEPAGTTSNACLAAILAVGAQQTDYDGGRSTVHTDVTYLLAQAVGFSSMDAYWIAAYDEATDLGAFEPRDNNSQVVAGGALATADISGVVRGDFPTGGVLLHFIAPYNGGSATPPAINGLAPDPRDAKHEPTLANLRAWALAASSAAWPFCTAGLTVQSSAGDYGTGASCYAPTTSIMGSIAAVGAVAVPIPTQTGLQIVRDTDGLPTVHSPQFDALVAADGAHDASAQHASDARIGVYLHVLADRITHHVCTDQSVIAGPNASGFQIAMTNPDCDQPIHLLRHVWETGVDVSTLDAKDQTTRAMLSTIYDELINLARARGVLRGGADSAMSKATYLAQLAPALTAPAALDRVTALDHIACSHHLVAFPGQPACK